MKKSRHNLFSSGRGSVLMEFVLVLPIYMAAIGGILWLGMKSLDAVNLRAADHWGVWMAGNRFTTRLPAITALQEMFPRTTLITTSQERALTGEHSFLQFIGSKTTLMKPGRNSSTTGSICPIRRGVKAGRFRFRSCR